ncbi:MAG: dipeptide epimerase [Planctomycetales bacterium]|nr:dipeptide epimerase [Planctomycetales bacterium]
MRMTLYQIPLQLTHEFTIARDSTSVQQSLIVCLEHDGIQGYGEVTENAYYGHTIASMRESLETARIYLYDFLEKSPAELWPNVHDTIGDDHFALAALDMAAHDLRGKRLGIPTWQDWGLLWAKVPDSSFTIGIDSLDTMVAKLAEVPGWPIYKIKLGTDHDLEIVKELRKHTQARFRVDANCGWTVPQTIDYSRELAGLGVEFIEQPLPADARLDDHQAVFEQSALPIIADESCQVEADVAACHGLFHGVNVKVCKCGGLTPAVRMLNEARQLKMRTMVGCMVESSVGISGAAQLLPLLDYADLDGALLIRNDPAVGVTIEKGRVQQPRRSGTGVSLLPEIATMKPLAVID